MDLSGVARAADVASAVAAALGVTPLPGEEPPATLRAFLAERRLLLVIDNFEHVLPAAAMIGELLSACPVLTGLTTSRAALDLRAEHRMVLEPLPLTDAAELFVVAKARTMSAIQAARSGFLIADPRTMLHAAERTRAKDGIVTLLGQPVFGFFVGLNRQPLFNQLLVEAFKLNVDDLHDMIEG